MEEGKESARLADGRGRVFWDAGKSKCEDLEVQCVGVAAGQAGEVNGRHTPKDLAHQSSS